MLTARVGAVDLAYAEHGSGDPVLFINGTGEPGATWLGQVAPLAERYRCVVYDARDVGGATYVDEPYVPRDLAADAAGLIEHLALGPCHVVGYSLGGATAQELAIARPDLVRSLVLLSTWARSDGWFAAQMRCWQALRRAFEDDEAGFLRALSPWLFAPATFDAPGRVEAFIEGWEALPPQRPDGWIRQCGADIAHDAAERLGVVRAPAVVIVGADDVCTPPRYSHELCALLPQAELVSIPGTAHCALFERPDEVTRAIDRFLAAH